MNRRKYIVGFLLAGIGVSAVILLRRSTEPSYHGHRLGWWIDQHGGSQKLEANNALGAIGTNAEPYLIQWIRNVDVGPSQARHCVSLIINHFPKGIEPDSVASWADENAFRARIGGRAWFAAAAFSVLGTNATPCIPELKALTANTANGTACAVAESALVRIGPEGFAAVLEIIGTAGLPWRGALMQSDIFAEQMRKPRTVTTTGPDTANFRLNSTRAAPVLLKCLGDGDPSVRERAFLLLSHSDPDAMVPALTNFLAGSLPPAIRRQATEALARHGQDARIAIPFLLSRFSNSDHDISLEASNALTQIAPEALIEIAPHL